MDVLGAVVDSSGEKGPTRLLYASNLSWTRMDGILTLLGEKGLIVWDWVAGYSELHRNNIHATVRGRELLTEYRKLRKDLGLEAFVEVYLPDSETVPGTLRIRGAID